MVAEIGFNAKESTVPTINNSRMSVMRFEDAAQPVFVEKKGKPYVLYGEKNDYLNNLLY